MVWLFVEGDFKTHPVLLLVMGRNTFHQTKLLQAFPN